MPINKEHLPHRVKTSSKITKVKTVADMLTRDDINQMMRDLEKEKPNISDLIIVYMEKETNNFYFQVTKDTLASTAVYMLECTKLDIINEDFDEEDS